MNKKIYITAGFLSLIIIFGVAWFLGKKSLPLSQPNPSAVVFPPTLSEKSVLLKKQITRSDKKAGDITSDYPDFRIDYLITNDEFIVTIKTKPYEDFKKKAEDWFLNQGFAQSELCFLHITFVASKQISPDLTLEDALPTGCSK